jgi:hypothetical protein
MEIYLHFIRAKLKGVSTPLLCSDIKEAKPHFDILRLAARRIHSDKKNPDKGHGITNQTIDYGAKSLSNIKRRAIFVNRKPI